MIIDTKFEIGHTFWVARVYDEMRHETIEVDGKAYERRYYERVPIAKEKVIDAIDISIDEFGMEILYKVKDAGDITYNIPKLCPISEINRFASRDDAMAFAEEWIKTNNTTYYGEPLNR